MANDATGTEKIWTTLGFVGHIENFGCQLKEQQEAIRVLSKRGPRSDLHIKYITLAAVLNMIGARQEWR